MIETTPLDGAPALACAEGNPFDTDTWWDESGMWWGLHTALDPVRIPYLLERLRRSPRAVRRVVDIGCGGGYVAAGLTDAGYDVVGVEKAPGAVASARSRATGVVRADAATLPFVDESFDAAVVSEVLEHAEAPGSIVAQAARLLPSGGLLFVTGPNRTALSRFALITVAQRLRLTRVLPADLHDWNTFIRPDEIRGLLARAGCELVDITGVGMPVRRLPGAAAALVGVRRGRRTFGELGAAAGLTRIRSTALAYMATAVRR